MKKISTLLSLCALSLLPAQTVLLDDNFESYTDFAFTNFGSWTGLDLDNLDTYPVDYPDGPPQDFPNEGGKMAFQVINVTGAGGFPTAYSVWGDPNYAPHSGNKFAGSWASQMVASGQGNNDWLITPSLTLGASGNVLTFWVKSVAPAYGQERYKVGVYTGTGNPTSSANFTIVHGNNANGYVLAPEDWQMVTINLDAYAGQTIKIGFNCISQETWMLAIDDVKVVTASTLGTADVNRLNAPRVVNVDGSQYKIITAKDFAKAYIYDVSGKIIKETASPLVEMGNSTAGIYIFKILFKDGSQSTVKVLKK